MKVLVIGSGGREDAISWKLSQDEKIEKIFVSPGNAGGAQRKKVENINLVKVDEIIEFAQREGIYMTIVGNEELLVDGIVDRFKEKKLKIFGPDKMAARLEGSKSFGKKFMEKYGIKTAKYRIVDNLEEGKSYVKTLEFPIVIKASGLAGGKGVVICKTLDHALETLEGMMNETKFGKAGKEVVIEEYLVGKEASILSITDSETILQFISAKDHKKIGEGEEGLNTGGMGVIVPNPYVSPEILKEFEEGIMAPTLKGIKSEKMDFSGVIFFGLMITEKGVYLLEYNMRFGDPETQGVMPLLENSLIDILDNSLKKELNKVKLSWKEESTCCVVAVSEGYPVSYEKGKKIEGIEEVEEMEGIQLFYAGVKKEGGEFLTNGGRVLNIIGKGKTLEFARKRAYSGMEKIKFPGKYIRRDI